MYIYYVCFEDFVVYKCNDGFSGYSRTRAINQGSNEKSWGVIVFGKPLICTRGACGSVLFTLPLHSSGYVEGVKQLTYFMASFIQLSYFSSRRYERKWCIFAYFFVATNFFGTTSAKRENEHFYIYSKKLRDQNQCRSFNTGITSNTGDKVVIRVRAWSNIIALTCRISRRL